MSGDITTIARPYAEAAFERGKEVGQLDGWSEALAMLGTVVADPTLAAQIGNPKVPREQVRELILEVCGDSLPPEVANLVRLLAANGRLEALPEISRLFEAKRTADQGVRHVLVRSAYDVSAADLKALSSALAKRLGGQVEIETETDPSLIGGVEIRAGDLVIDDSVRGKLKQMAHALQL